MPSMHVAQTFLFFLAMRHVSIFWSRLALAFLGVIFLGSVHLAYHYATDGIAAALMVIPLWYVAGILARTPSKPGFGWLGRPVRDPLKS